MLETELNVVDDPNSWDVINPNKRTPREWDAQLYSLEQRAEELYSADHLHMILEVRYIEADHASVYLPVCC